MVSPTYPAYHYKKGQNTYFIEKILNSVTGARATQLLISDKLVYEMKRHTFRGNYPLWKKRIDEVLAGNAVIVLKYHSLGRYVKGNKQIEFARLDKDSGVGVQEGIYKTDFEEPFSGMAIRCEDGVFRDFPFYQVADGDGLTDADFACWFEKGKYELTEPMACIHFTSFRYGRP
jgi:hypothetical protein